MYDYILIRYGEIALKGKNQINFINRLIDNIKDIINQSSLEMPKIEKERGRIFLKITNQQAEQYFEPLKKVFGILSFSPVRKANVDLSDIQKIALEEFKSLEKKPENFRVTVKRSYKGFPLNSLETQQKVGGFLLKNFPDLKVDLHNPEAEVYIEIRKDAAYVYTKIIPGLGGLPLGTGGKAILLLSGGIDSPVAGWLTMKRGIVIEAIHFYSYPYTSERAKEKVLNLARVLAQYSGEVKIHVVPFTRIQEVISKNCYESLWITIMRRFMFRIAEKIAEKQKALALVTGESLGQVASQTIESMYAINHVIKTPVIRPLITMDKEEIMKMAQKIGTYEISILPYEDCCTVFLPKEPKTKPKVEACLKAEENLNISELIEEAINNTEVVVVNKKEDDEFGYF